MTRRIAPLWRLLAAMILACCVGSARADGGAQEAETSGTLPLSELPIVMVGYNGMSGDGVFLSVYEDGRVLRPEPRSVKRETECPLLQTVFAKSDFAKLLTHLRYAQFDQLPDRLVTAEQTNMADVGTTVIWLRRGDRVKLLSVYALGWSDGPGDPKIDDPDLKVPIEFGRQVLRFIRDYEPTKESVIPSTRTIVNMLDWPDTFKEDAALPTAPWPEAVKYEFLSGSVPDWAGRDFDHVLVSGPYPSEMLRASTSRPRTPILFEGRRVTMDHRWEFPGEFQLKKMAVEAAAKAGSSK